MHVILDYDTGNLDSVSRGFARMGIDTVISKDSEVIRKAESLILPGVGAFGESMKALEVSGLIPLIKRHIKSGKYLLGICLGMQLLYEESTEYGRHTGLGVFPGRIEYLDVAMKVPHMGWNDLRFNRPNDPILKYINTNDYVYFVHSFYAVSMGDEVIAYTDYGVKIPAIVSKGNVYATQFHPEKSGSVGLKILKAYGEMIR